MATVKCQVCGAPMDGNTCGYCGYQATVAPQQTVQTPPAQPTHVQEQAKAQPQVQTHYVGSVPPVTEIHHVYHSAPRVSRRNKGTALILCFFLGAWGAHHFYAGKIGMGIVYFLTVGLLGFGVLIDFIRLLLGSYRDVEGLFIK